MNIIQSAEIAMDQKAGKFMLLAHPFRIFFLATGIYAMLAVFGWLAFLFGGWPLPVGWAPLQWHSHEMLYGFVVAAIAGFMLTAMTNWTGAPPLQNKGLLALVLLWLAGRAVMWFADWFTPWLVTLVDLAFLPVLAIYVFQVLWRYQNRRNLVLVLVLTLLFSGNVWMHAGFISGNTLWLQKGQLIGFDLITLLIAIIAGRITPAFSGNWLRMRGQDDSKVRRWSFIEIPALLVLALLFIADTFGAPAKLIGLLALTAAVLHAVRLYGWAGWLVVREPLLWILHLAYVWLVVALALRGFSAFAENVGSSVWQHALGVGTIGTIILGVMTRVAVGHTGRPLRLLPWALGIYLAITLAALMRILVALGFFNFRLGVGASAVAWVLAFGLFVIIYGPVLASARADGKPG